MKVSTVPNSDAVSTTSIPEVTSVEVEPVQSVSIPDVDISLSPTYNFSQLLESLPELMFAAQQLIVDPTKVQNNTFTATTIQEAFEQQETKTIYGGSY